MTILLLQEALSTSAWVDGKALLVLVPAPSPSPVLALWALAAWAAIA
jgi:hypothetical protein